jgi:hypothetical protein
MTCPTCKVNKAEVHPQFGVIACKSCRDKAKEITDRTYEFVPEHIKKERKEFKDQTIQPFRNGELSKEYVDLYGSKYIDASPEEVKNAKNVWSRDLPGEFYKR